MITSRDDPIAQLAWIAPSADSLVALATSPTPWLQVRDDPGAVFLLARQPISGGAGHISYCSRRLQSDDLFVQALDLLEASGYADWQQPAHGPTYEASWRIAQLSSHVAETLQQGDADEAWTAGMIAALGWLATTVLDCRLVQPPHSNGEFLYRIDSPHVENGCTERATAARRLVRSWGMPARLCGAVHLGLPVETAVSLGADPFLFRTVQLAVELLRQHAAGLDLPTHSMALETATALGASAEQFDKLESDARELATRRPPERVWQPPCSKPLLRELLALAAEVRRLRFVRPIQELEQQIEALHGTVQTQHSTFARRLEESKLGAMAEFAAGAGHEINNPLAVISGQAQYLLRTIDEDGRSQRILGLSDSAGSSPTSSPPPPNGDGNEASAPQHRSGPSEQTVLRLPSTRFRDCLQKSIQQTQRIHELLRQLMLFARPPRPHPQEMDLVMLTHEVATAHSELAAERRVRLIVPDHGPAMTVLADPGQLRIAIAHLVRNAIQAAGPEGWVNLWLERPSDERVGLVVEDSGPGPDRRQRDHLFEPFFSGRTAGRGRGLGLPIAWRLAREQGGDVEFVPRPGGPTRFTLTLPAAATPPLETTLPPHAVLCNGSRH